MSKLIHRYTQINPQIHTNHTQIHTNIKYPFKKETYKIIGSCMEVHSELGCGTNLQHIFDDHK